MTYDFFPLKPDTRMKIPVLFLCVNCTMHCKGTFIANNSLYDEEKICVNFTLNLPMLTNLHENTPPTFHKKYCNISKCIYDWFSVTCAFPKQTDIGSEIGSADINMNSEIQEYEQKYLLVAFACVVAGCMIGVLLTLTGRRCTNHRRTSPSSADQDQTIQRTGDSIDNLYMYCDIEDTARISEKGVQVPSLKDKSPSSMRSGTSNVYRLLNEKESPIDSLTSTVGTTSRGGSTSEDNCHNTSLREKNSAAKTSTVEQAFETGNENRNYFQLEMKPEDSLDI
ncbi:uncharacterized protein LOC134281766 isoform X2 [Saccostrea cucullata]|uniref:uncharacterized protein LOC134281766 isoform X2 n=1 Tax=Saccostrea cuccullata TaxID=36930 RepID=UPI002ED0D39A